MNLRICGTRLHTWSGLLSIILVSSCHFHASAEPKRGSLNVLIENDLFYGLDRNYTNGFAISWTPHPEDTVDWTGKLFGRLPWVPETSEMRRTYALGQNIYTPSDISLASPLSTDRPYAGWLYGAMGVASQSGTLLDQLQVQVGVVGPASLAEQTQTLVHELADAIPPQGWDMQLQNELGVNLIYQRSWKALQGELSPGFDYDLTTHVGGAFGNVFTYANSGAMMRVGLNLTDDFGPNRIQPSLPGTAYFDSSEDKSFYVFAGFDGRAVARNIFLDGNTWQHSRSVEKRPFVADVEIGVAFHLGRARIAYTHVFRSQEFESADERDEFGAISLSFGY